MATSQIKSAYSVRLDESVNDRYNVRNTIAGVKYNTCRMTFAHERQQGLRFEHASTKAMFLKN